MKIHARKSIRRQSHNKNMDNLGKIYIVSTMAFFILTLFLIKIPLEYNEKIIKPAKNNFLPPNKEKISQAEAKTVKMLLVGDIMLDRRVKERIASQSLDYLFRGLDELKLNNYDLINSNLEGAVTDGGFHYSPVYSYDFAFAPELIEKLRDYNFKIFNLANNHFSDQGERGIVESRNNLAKLGDDFYGCRDGETGECSTGAINAGELKIGFAGFSMVYKKINLIAASDLIADLKTKTDFVIVNAHWGIEYEHNFSAAQTEAAHKLIEAGADVIIGHHPHVVQGLEIYKNKLIFYSLGNFIFDQYFSRDTQEELAVELEINIPEPSRAVLIPLISEQSQPSPMAGLEKEKYLEKIAGWSNGGDEFLKQIRKGEIEINF